MTDYYQEFKSNEALNYSETQQFTKQTMIIIS